MELARKIGDDELAQKKEARMATKRQQQQQEGGQVVAASTQSSSKGPTAQPTPTPNAKKRKEKGSAKGVSFEEFMAVMAPSKKRKTWQNEEAEPEQKLESGAVEQDMSDAKKEQKKQKKKEREQQAEEQRNAQAAAASSTATQPVERDATPDEALDDEGLTDMEYMARRMRRGVGKEEVATADARIAAPHNEKAFDQSDSEADSDADDSESDDDAEEGSSTRTKEQAERERKDLEEKARKDQEAVDTIMVSARLFVRNLPFAVTEEELSNHFAQFGPIKQVSTHLDL